MVLAAVGMVACFSFAPLVAANPALEKDVLEFLFPGLFVVWVPTVLLMNRLTRDFKQRDIWKAALRGCPSWMRMGLWAVVGFAFVFFFAPFLWGSDPGKSPASFVVFPSIFYSVSFCTMYSLLHADKVDEGNRCLNGHRISPLAKYCEECGAPAAPKEMRGTV
jgi:hypothetical protein